MNNHSVLAIGINTVAEEKVLIQEKLKQKDINLDIASIKDPIFTIIDGRISVEIEGRRLDQYDYIWIQSGWKTTHMAYLLDICLEALNIQHNKTTIQNTKLSDIFSLARNDIRVPNTFFHNGPKSCERNIPEIEEVCKLPCIYKTTLGSLGSHVYLVERYEDIEKTIKKNGKYNKFVFQEYIPNDFDYRIVIANGIPTSVSRRTRIKDKFRNNVALGAREDFIDINKVSRNILDLAIQASLVLKLDWAGVDVVIDNESGKEYILEVNRRPGLTEHSTEITAAYNYIETLVL